MSKTTKNNSNQKKQIKLKTLYPNKNCNNNKMSNTDSAQKKKNLEKEILKKLQNRRNNLNEFLDWSVEQGDFWLEGYEEKLEEIASNNYSTCEIECIDSKIKCIQEEIEQIEEQIDAGWCGDDSLKFDRFDAERILDGEEPLFRTREHVAYFVADLLHTNTNQNNSEKRYLYGIGLRLCFEEQVIILQANIRRFLCRNIILEKKNMSTQKKNETGEFAIRTKNQIFKDMEELIWEIFGDGSIGIPMTDSGFVNDDGFTLGSTTEGNLNDDIRYTIDYELNGVCLDDEIESIGDLDVGGTWKKLYEEYKAIINSEDESSEDESSEDESSEDESSEDESSEDEWLSIIKESIDNFILHIKNNNLYPDYRIANTTLLNANRYKMPESTIAYNKVIHDACKNCIYNYKNISELKKIGSIVNDIYGFNGMQTVYYGVNRICVWLLDEYKYDVELDRNVVVEFGAINKNLQYVWDGIGEWVA